MEQIRVVFRKFRDDGSIIALFPRLIAYPKGECESYMRIGQHGAANYEHVLKITIKAHQNEYQDLKTELEYQGYDLKVRTCK